MNDASSSFGRLLKRHRLEAQLTQEELAERAHLSARAISDLERGIKVVPRRETVEQLANALDVPVEKLEQGVLRRRGPRSTQPRTGLPSVATSFVGRDVELHDVSERLRQSTTRLVTVVGPPGIGKTRLALAVGEEMLGEFSDSVVFVSLAGLRDPAHVASNLTQALGIQHSDSSTIEQSLIEYLQPKHHLLIVDNFEHLLDASVVVARILAACPRVKMLVTSRAALNIQGECRYDLGPLPFPSPGFVPALDEISRYPALLLFVERAKAVNPRFQVTPGNLPAIVGVCQRLTGLPLAIELACVRTNVLSPQLLLERLDRQLHVLTGGPRDLPDRHHTMRDAIAWSYDLLNDREQRLFRQLAIFAGSFSLEAVEAVVDLGARETGSVLNALASLVDQNLVRTQQGELESVRFTMLDSIQEFGLERLGLSRERVAITAQHCEFFVSLAEQGYREQISDQQVRWFRRLEEELDNLRSAASWIVEQRDDSRAVRLGLSLWRFWDRGHIAEGRRWLDEFLALPGLSAPSPGRCRLLFAAGRLAYRQADHSAATLFLRECLDIARDQEDDDFAGAALAHLGHVSYAVGDLDAAECCYAESLTLRRNSGDVRTIGITLHGMARVARARGDYASARTLLQERLSHLRETQDVVQITTVLVSLGLVELLEGNYAGSKAFYHEGLVRSLEVDDQPAVATSLLGLAITAVGNDDSRCARSLLHKSLLIAREIGARHHIALCLEGFAAVLAIEGEARRSWRLAGAVSAYRDRLEVPRDPSEHTLFSVFLDRAASMLEPVERASLWASGRSMTISDAFAEIGLATSPGRSEQITSPFTSIEMLER